LDSPDTGPHGFGGRLGMTFLFPARWLMWPTSAHGTSTTWVHLAALSGLHSEADISRNADPAASM